MCDTMCFQLGQKIEKYPINKIIADVEKILQNLKHYRLILLSIIDAFILSYHCV